MRRFQIIPVLAALTVTGTLAAADLSDVQFHGFASQGYLYTTDNNFLGRTTDGGTFEFNEFALNAVARPVDRLRIGVQLFAGDQGKYGNDELQLDYAYGSYDLPSLIKGIDFNVTAGRFKPNHGLYNDYRDLDTSRATVFLPMSVYPTTFRDMYIAVNGFQVGATWRAGAFGSFDLAGYVGAQNISHEAGSPIADMLTNGGAITLTDINVRRVGGGSLTWNTPVDGWRIKGSVIHATDITATGNLQPGYEYGAIPGTTLPITMASTTLVPGGAQYEIPSFTSIIVGTELQRGNLTLAAEYLNEYSKAIVDWNTNFQAPFIGSVGPINRVIYSRNQGGYISAAYRFHPKWEAALGGSMLYVDDMEDETDAVSSIAKNRSNTVSVALRFDPTDHWLIKMEYQRTCGTYMIQEVDNGATETDPIGTQSRYWNLFAVKTTFDF